MARIFRTVCVVASLASLLGPVMAGAETSRAPLCDIPQVRSRPVDSDEVGFRSAFCEASTARSCDERWSNGRRFLKLALADPRILDVGTIAYMFGTIYAETANGNFSPSAKEIIGSSNKNRAYVKDGFYGRGWIQLTYKDKYALASKALGKDLVKQPELALAPDNAYEILYRGMTEGWIEVYRTSIDGAVAREVPIKLSDFVNAQEVNYDLARSVINANCRKTGGKCNPPNIEMRSGLYIPPPSSLDAGAKAALAATRMEKLLCSTKP